MKKIFSIAIALILAMSMSSAVFAADTGIDAVNVYEISRNNDESMGGSEIADVDPATPMPMQMKSAFSINLTGNKSTSANITFTDEFKYFTMTVRNTGNAAINVDLGNKTYRVEAHSSKIIYSTSAWGAQTCTFYFGTANAAYTMSGTVDCMLATTLSEVTP